MKVSEKVKRKVVGRQAGQKNHPSWERKCCEGEEWGGGWD